MTARLLLVLHHLRQTVGIPPGASPEDAQNPLQVVERQSIEDFVEIVVKEIGGFFGGVEPFCPDTCPDTCPDAP
jgi:hypothetical protein